MSSTPRVEGSPESFIRLCTLVFPYPLPKAKKSISYTRSFGNPSTPKDTVAVMETADHLRDQVLDELLCNKPNCPAIVATSERYIPVLHRIIASIDASDKAVRLTQRMQFQWTSAINTQGQSNFLCHEVFIFEMAMVLASRGLALSNISASAVNPTIDRFGEAAKFLKDGAGVFIALAQDFLPRWKETSENASTRHPETSEGVAMAFIDLMTAQAQAMAVGKALFVGTTPKGLLAKLCVGVADKFEKAVSNFRARAPIHFCRLDADLLTYVTFMIGFYRGLAYYFFGLSLWEKDDHGTGIGLLQQALVQLRTRPEMGAAGLPPMESSGFLSKNAKDLLVIRQEIQAQLNSFIQDNNIIYFSPVPPSDTLPPLPAGTVMVQLVKYSYSADLPSLVFEEDTIEAPQPPPAPDAPPAPDTPTLHRSDSDLARELQEKLNAEDAVRP